MFIFKKSNDGHFICEECGLICNGIKGLSIHIGKIHNSKLYFDRWLKDENDDKCKICKKQTKFLSIGRGYKNTCSYKCSNIYGCEQSSKGNMIKYGVKRPSQLNKFKEKSKETCLKNWSVEHPMQNKEIFDDYQRNSVLIKNFKNTDIKYQGTFELDFLEKVYDLYPDVKRGPAIKYISEGKNKIYYPDFFIPSLNLIIEIKSNWIAEQQGIKQIEAKRKATIANGFDYIMIIDKKYNKFLNKINK
jgi:hypothetical protein